MPQHTSYGAGAPVGAPAALSLHYVDTTTGDSYLSTGTASVADWGDPLGSGTGGSTVPASRVLRLTDYAPLQTCNLSEDYDQYTIRIDEDGATWNVILPDSDHYALPRFRFTMFHSNNDGDTLVGITLKEFGGVYDFNRTNLNDVVADFTPGNSITFELAKVEGNGGLFYWRYRLLDTFPDSAGGS